MSGDRYYFVKLRVQRREEESHPGLWNWESMLDSVTNVVEVIEETDAPVGANSMIARIDGGEPITVRTDAKVILGQGRELHVTVTHEGVIFDAVVDGEVVSTDSREHDYGELEEGDE